MKRLMVIAALAVVPLACVANQGDAPVRFLHARALDPSCKPVEDSYISAGTLDVSGGQNYRLTLAIETNNRAQQIVIGQEDFSGDGLSDITLNELIYSYESQPYISLPEEERVPIYAVYRPGTDPDQSTLTVGGFGPEALDMLKEKGVVPETVSVTVPVVKDGQIGERSVERSFDGITVFSTIKGRGVMSGGQIVETNEITFPIAVVNSGYKPGTPAGTCENGKPPAGQGFFVCVYGQDGIGRICPKS
ncbi:hypothetical protein [Archangium sp.]|uniref:hypothetical protein n=1 Tax=Archangium sp. TaxID=1872627 RepID=UPI002D2C58D3|nr:hypothetical protein [Archangium sp.]HYO60046.1 hypothetical protein [Archangium sp.]